MIRCAAGAVAATALGWRGSAWAETRRPNFVFINIDDQAWNALGASGRFPFLETPNMNRLAREGARFDNAFVTISLCSPSRACSLTGCYAHRHDVRTNESTDPLPELPTYAQVLQQAGYETAHIGKWHMEAKADPRPGFDYWLSFKGQGRYENPDLNENGRDFTEQGYMTDILTDYAVKWLKVPREKPFCMNLWHKAVHGPFTPAPRHTGAFPDAELPKPPNADDTFADKPAWLRRNMTYGARRDEWKASEGKPVPESIPPVPWDAKNAARLDYLRTLLAVDESIGRVLATLDEMGQLDHTVVVFTSDNGFFLGEHRRGDKRLAYEESLRIPLIVRYPGLATPGAVLDSMALNIDVAPTLLELAGAAIPDSMQGRSLVPLLRGDAGGWRESFLYEYFQEAWQQGIPTILAVRTARWKYITYPDLDGEMVELYDLENDPIEMHNLAQDSAHADRLEAMRAELERLKKETEYGAPRPRRVDTKLELALAYAFKDTAGGRVPDASGNGNDGILNELEGIVEAGGLVFDGNGYIMVPGKGKQFSCGRKSLTVGGWAVPSSRDGVLVAWGGESNGFSLYVRGGQPCFAIRASSAEHIVESKVELAEGRRIHLAAVLTGSGGLRLFVDGLCVAEQEEGGHIVTRPNEDLTVGADIGSLVGEYAKPLLWKGRIDEVRLYWGELDDTSIAKWARNSLDLR